MLFARHEVDDEVQTRAQARRWRDGEIIRLQSLAREHAGEEAPDDDLTRAVRAKHRLYRTGSFPQLEVGLFQLQVRYPLRHDALRLFVIDQHADPSPPIRVRLDETVDWLAGRMPRPILLPGDARGELEAWKLSLQHGKTPGHMRQRFARDAEIRRLSDTGWSLRRLGQLWELSPEGVRKILERTAPVAVATAAA